MKKNSWEHHDIFGLNKMEMFLTLKTKNIKNKIKKIIKQREPVTQIFKINQIRLLRQTDKEMQK